MTEVIVIDLTPSITYNFRIEAVNLVGYGPYSEVLVELASQVPDMPTDLADLPAITARF